jgi:hypothetical protein
MYPEEKEEKKKPFQVTSDDHLLIKETMRVKIVRRLKFSCRWRFFEASSGSLNVLFTW